MIGEPIGPAPSSPVKVCNILYEPSACAFVKTNTAKTAANAIFPIRKAFLASMLQPPLQKVIVRRQLFLSGKTVQCSTG